MRIHHQVYITGRTTAGDDSLKDSLVVLHKVVRYSKTSSRIKYIVCKHPDTCEEIHFDTDNFSFIEAPTS